jgi:hypothetical protein
MTGVANAPGRPISKRWGEEVMTKMSAEHESLTTASREQADRLASEAGLDLTAEERAGLEALTALAAAEHLGEYEPIVVSLGPWSAWTLVSALQLVWQHEEMTPEQRTLIRQFADPVQAQFTGPAAELLADGWGADEDER